MHENTRHEQTDGAFFDGYVWGRLQEHHDRQQHGDAGEHCQDTFDGDDRLDDDA